MNTVKNSRYNFNEINLRYNKSICASCGSFSLEYKESLALKKNQSM